MKFLFWVVALVSLPARADWPMLHGDSEHSGYVDLSVRPPFRLAWARHFDEERLGTAMEPIVADNKVFIATHAGNLYALDAQSGNPQWRFAGTGAFLNSPACAGGVVIAASSEGYLYALEGSSGTLRWNFFAGHSGFSASPIVAKEHIFICTRAGEFLALGLKSGKLSWQLKFDAPIRQTAAYLDDRVFVTAEDLRVRCLQASSGKLLWTSEPLAGQTARDYYPMLLRSGNRSLVIVRTNPIDSMANHITQDRHMLCQQAGIDDRDWRSIDAWIKSEPARGNGELWTKEQQAIVQYLEERRETRSFFVLDAATGKPALTPPVLWVAGCQGVGAMPALSADGRLLVFYRSAYGNWNHGVAPLVALGLLDLNQNRITPLFHKSGIQPPWNTFWGTADESQNFVVANDTVLIVHQGTLSGFNLKSNDLFPIWGERDTFGGFRNPPWARNEWHGPARSGVAVAGNRIYWQTGSRILCLVAGEKGDPAQDVRLNASTLRTQRGPKLKPPGTEDGKRQLTEAVAEFIAQRWAPLYVEPGLHGREFFFDGSGDIFESLAWAYPCLPAALQRKTKTYLATEWADHFPCSRAAGHSLKDGQRREFFWTPANLLSRLGHDKLPHPFGNVYSTWLYAEKCGERQRVHESWPRIKKAWEQFAESGWRLDRDKGDLYANRYLSSLIAFQNMAREAGDSAVAAAAKLKEDETSEALLAWWRHSAARLTTNAYKGSAELDPFINSGDGLFFRIAPHRHKIALFHELTPEVAAVVKSNAPEAVEKIWRAFESLCPTWHLMGEERQVHYGENFVDPPDFALDAFKAWLRDASAQELARRVDIPFCRADLSCITKLALAVR
jgi:hypothetical protein